MPAQAYIQGTTNVYFVDVGFIAKLILLILDIREFRTQSYLEKTLYLSTL